MRVELPSGETVEMRERMTNGDRKRYLKIIDEMPETIIKVPVTVKDIDGEVIVDKDGKAQLVRDEHNNPILEERTVPTTTGTYEALDALLAIVIESWSYGFAIPAERRESLDDLDPADYDHLAAAARPLAEKLMPNFSVSKDKESPSGPSSV